jgi:hypothetical protein
MFRRWGLLCVAMTIVQGSACAQNPPAPNVAEQLSQAQQDINAMKSDIAGIKNDIAGLIQAVRARNDGPLNSGNQPAQPPTLQQLAQDVQDLKLGQEKLQDDVGELRAAMNQITMTTETGQHYLRFDTNSQPAREELKRAIKSTVPPKGQFVIRNRTPWPQTLYVNSEAKYIAPYGEETVPVNPGAVMSWLPGEQKLTWQIGLPDFKQVVELHPRQPTYVAGWAGY